MPKIKVFIKRPDSGWYATNISPSRANIEKIAGGAVDMILLAQDLALISSVGGACEEYCCSICNLTFFGTVIAAGKNKDGLCDIPIDLKTFRSIINKE